MQLIKSMIRKHPYFSILLLWLYAFCVCGRFQIEDVSSFNYFSVLLFGAVLLLAERKYISRQTKDHKLMEEDFKKTAILVGIVGGYTMLTLYVFSLIPYSKGLKGRNPMVLLAAGIIFSMAAAFYWKIRKQLNHTRKMIIIFVMGLSLHLYYHLYMGYLVQCDLGYWSGDGSGSGHFGYIEYLYRYGWPAQFDPRDRFQFYHPPLNHALSALLMRIQTLCGVAEQVAIYNITFMPLLYCLVSIYSFVRIARYFHAGASARRFLCLILIFSQPLILIGSYINNDMLSIMLSILALEAALEWNDKRTYRQILRIAVFFGLGMLTKLSVWMIAVPIAVIFLWALFSQLKKRDFKAFRRLFAQMAAFMAVAAPLSFYWSIRNLLRFGIPVGYVPLVNDIYHKIQEPLQVRLFDFSLWQLHIPWVCYVDMDNPVAQIAGNYNEYNPLIAAVKSSLIYSSHYLFSSRLSMWITVLFCAVAFLCMVYVLIRKDILSVQQKMMIGGTYLVMMICYYVFCIRFPQVCTEDIRYAAPVIYLTVLCTALVLERTWQAHRIGVRIVSRGILFAAVAYCMVSFYIVTLDGIDYVCGI